jgi:hypothetical protein
VRDCELNSLVKELKTWHLTLNAGQAAVALRIGKLFDEGFRRYKRVKLSCKMNPVRVYARGGPIRPVKGEVGGKSSVDVTATGVESADGMYTVRSQLDDYLEVSSSGDGIDSVVDADIVKNDLLWIHAPTTDSTFQLELEVE